MKKIRIVNNMTESYFDEENDSADNIDFEVDLTPDGIEYMKYSNYFGDNLRKYSYKSGVFDDDLKDDGKNNHWRNHDLFYINNGILIKNLSNFPYIVVPNCIEIIGEEAFANSTVKIISIPNSTINIGYRAFCGCEKLSRVFLNEGLKKINSYAFAGCSSLKSISLPSSVTTISQYAFNGCEKLTNIIIPEGAITIGNDVFKGCSSLKKIIIPSSVKKIGDGVISYCEKLECIIVNDKNKIYDSRNNCNAIIETATKTLVAGCKNTIIPEGVMTIKEYAFYGCKELQNIIIPNGVTSIENDAFKWCSGLEKIIIPDSITSIGKDAFFACKSLKYNEYDNALYLGNEVNPYLVLIKAKNSNIISCSINAKTKIICDSAFEGCYDLTDIKIPEGVIEIGGRAFAECRELKNILIPSSVSCMGHEVFRCCRKLENIIVDKGNSVFDSRNNCNGVIFTSSNELIEGCGNTVIPEGVTSIGVSAFKERKNLINIKIPDSVISIGEEAFWGCINLKNIEIPTSIENIKSMAFAFTGLEHTCTKYDNGLYL